MGCWLGKNAGGTLGEPLEEKFGRDEMFHVDWYPSLPKGGIPNDDLELQLIWLQVLLQKGPGITSADLVEAWMDCIAYNFDEYGLSKENMQKGLMPPVCGWNNNAFRDCMGSPIRSEIWACLAPGCPEIAAKYAFQDAIVDHGGGESVYGEIFNAVLESAAFVNDNKFELLELALSSIPKDSITYQCVRKSIDNYQAGLSYADNRNDLKKAFYHPVAQYSPLNLGYQTIGWLYGEGFGDSICKAVNCGWDTDCTAATLGAILGIIGGASSLPKEWIDPLGYEIATNMTTGGIRNLTAPTDIKELTEVVCREAETVIGYCGGKVNFQDMEAMSTQVTFPKLNLSWLNDYQVNGIHYRFTGIVVDVLYDQDAAILGNRNSKVVLNIKNPHATSKNLNLQFMLPAGFKISPEEVRNMKLPGHEAINLELLVSATDRVIRESNKGYIAIDILDQPAVPAIPLVLVGGSKWLVSKLMKGKKIDDDCGIREDKIFVTEPEGFDTVWRAGNDLKLSDRFNAPGVIYALHYVYSQEEKDVVLGVPNNGYMKLFLNGEMIHRTKKKVPLRANLGNGGALGDLSNYKVAKLRQGWNQILIKLEYDGTPLAHEAHFTIGGMSDVCYKNHGMPVLGINRSLFQWE